MVWQCSEGRFNWYYDFDETILILEGSIVLENDAMSPTRYVPGDVIFFKDGAHAKWHVEGHVRKLAFFRRNQPVLLAFALRAFSKIKRTLVSARKRSLKCRLRFRVQVRFGTKAEKLQLSRCFSLLSNSKRQSGYAEAITR